MILKIRPAHVDLISKAEYKCRYSDGQRVQKSVWNRHKSIL